MIALLACSLFLAGADPQPLRWTIHAQDGSYEGTCDNLAKDGTLTSGEKKTPGNTLVSLRRSGENSPEWPTEAHLRFASGERLVGTIIESEDPFLKLQPRWGKGLPTEELRFPLSSLEMVSFRFRDDESTRERDSVKRDQLVLNNGDTLVGSFLGIDRKKQQLQFQEGKNNLFVEIIKVQSLIFNSDLVRVRKPKGRYYRIVTMNGSRLRLAEASIDGKTFYGVTLFQEKFQFPLSDLYSLYVEREGIDYLSDLKPKNYEYRSFDREKFVWMPDRNVIGQQLRIRDNSLVKNYERGIGMHSESKIVYDLQGKYQFFEAEVGLDAMTGQRGSVDLGIEIDGKVVAIPEGERLTARSGIRRLRMDVKQAKELTLYVKWGTGGHVQDHVNWGDARLLK